MNILTFFQMRAICESLNYNSRLSQPQK